MGKFFAAAALAGSVLVGSVLPSSAAVFQLGTLSDGDNPGLNNSITPNTSFTDFFTFSLGVEGGSVSAIVSNTGLAIANFTLSLFTNAGTSAAPVTSGAALAASPPDTTRPQVLSFGDTPLSAGNYVVEITGTTPFNKGKNTSYGGNLSVNAVPLPSSVALFGVAVLGLGLVGAARRKNARTSEVKA